MLLSLSASCRAALAILVTLSVGACQSGGPKPPPECDPYASCTDDPPPPPPGSCSGCTSGGGSDGGVDACKTAPESQRLCAVSLRYTADLDAQSVEIRGTFRADGWTSGVAMALSGGAWTAALPAPWNQKVLYKFVVTPKGGGQPRWLADPQNPNQENDGQGGQNSVLMPATCATWTCTTGGPVGPPGAFDWRDAVMYFPFVDRFVDGDKTNNRPLGIEAPADFQGGDWAGLTQKIDDGYFDSLGVNALWLTVPAQQAGRAGKGNDGHNYSSYHGYWPMDLSSTEGRFGSTADLQKLVAAAHKRGMKVLMDYAMNHVHEDAKIYKDNPSWFNPLRNNGLDRCVCSDDGSSPCSWDRAPLVCWFADYLPDFNFNNKDALNYSVGNALSWINQYSFDGFRLDAVKHIEKAWLYELRRRLSAEVESKTKQHVYLVGETFSGDQGQIKSYVDPSSLLDGQFDFPLRAKIIGAILRRDATMGDLKGFMDSNDGFYGPTALMSTFIGNHDVPRAIHLGEDSPQFGPWDSGRPGRSWSNLPNPPGTASAYERVGLAMTLLMTSRGVPLIYYGDEIGLHGGGDPDDRKMMVWSGYNGWQTALLERMKKLGQVRKSHAALRRGSRTTLFVDNDVWVYKMVDGSQAVYVALNRGDSNQIRSVGGLPGGALRDELTGTSQTGPNLSIPARGALIFAP